MPAAAAATIATPQMVAGGKDHQAVLEIKITGLNFQPGLVGAVIGDHTLPAEAGLVALVRRDLREQRLRDLHAGAPAGAFVGGGGAELAVVGLAAQGAQAGLRRGC